MSSPLAGFSAMVCAVENNDEKVMVSLVAVWAASACSIQ
jgi:hypothetical protein